MKRDLLKDKRGQKFGEWPRWSGPKGGKMLLISLIFLAFTLNGIFNFISFEFYGMNLSFLAMAALGLSLVFSAVIGKAWVPAFFGLVLLFLIVSDYVQWFGLSGLNIAGVGLDLPTVLLAFYTVHFLSMAAEEWREYKFYLWDTGAPS